MTSNGVFDEVPSKPDFPAQEAAMRSFWREGDIYHKALVQREGAPTFIFYEGPPTANGLPHPGHCLTRTIKDVYPRYKTMDGFLCERKAGWDTHGLPVEIEVCKELGIIDGGKEAIEKIGVEKFNKLCLESVFRYTKEWEELTDRIGFWVDMDRAYVTFHQSYVESVWWALKQLFDKDLLYQGHKVVWWWAQGGTALSAGEVGEGYRDTEDPAVTLKFRLPQASLDQLGLDTGVPTSILAWTTTPWTLSSNTALAVGEHLDYVAVDVTAASGTERYILAAALVEKYFGEDAVEVKKMSATELIGLSYEPLFRYDTPQPVAGTGTEAYRYWVVTKGDFVTLDQGTGIVHLAPAFGEDDFALCRDNDLGFLCFVHPDGTFDERVTNVDPYDGSAISGRFCKEADKSIIRVLKDRNLLLKHEQYRHSYPFCPRADQDPLIQYARKSWFIRTQQFVDDFVGNNAKIQWQPEHIRDGRFGNFLANNVDWALSRERYWGTPLPIWICEETGHMEAIGSYAELLAKEGVEGVDVWEQAKSENPELSDHLKVHKPYIDAITYASPKAPKARMRRVPEVIDCWFDSGCMPFAQWGYPHLEGSEERFNARFPADFISEAIDQTRGWFYSLLAVSTMVFGKDKVGFPHPYKSCVCLGLLLGEDGEKLSKSKKNFTDPTLLFDKYGADALRWSLLASNPPTTTITFSERQVEESLRELFIRWSNVYSFFVIYANLDGFNPAEGAPASFVKAMGLGDVSGTKDGVATFRAPAERSLLDRWIISEFNRTTMAARRSLDAFDSYQAAKAVSLFVDALSNWYVRRSRARFWASEWTQDKADAYWTLYECLLSLSRLVAPFAPFMADATWQNLARAPFPAAAESVHLCSYPVARVEDLDEELVEEMRLVRESVSLGLNTRRTENIKVRQPLGTCKIILADTSKSAGLEKHLALIRDELNVKDVEMVEDAESYVTYEVVPNFRALGPKFGQKMPAIKKALAHGDGADFYNQLQNGGISLNIGGEVVTLGAEEVEPRLAPKEGFAASSGPQLAVVLSTEITPELQREGWVREFIRSVQELRKEQGLAYNDRIHLIVDTDDAGSAETLREFSDFIANEVLASSLQVAAATGETTKSTTIEGTDLRLFLTKV